MASDIQEFQKHCYAIIKSSKRRFEYADYGGKDRTIPAARHAIKICSDLINEFDTLNRKPTDRKTFVIKNFSADALLTHKSIAVQRECLISRLVNRKVNWVEASIMQAAVRALQPDAMKDRLSICYDHENEKFKASVDCDSNKDNIMTKLFDKIADARSWLLNMGKSSEARGLKNFNTGYINTRYLYIYILMEIFIYMYL